MNITSHVGCFWMHTCQISFLIFGIFASSYLLSASEGERCFFVCLFVFPGGDDIQQLAPLRLFRGLNSFVSCH